MDGIILIDKPQGITSFSAVNSVRKRLGVKCGHSGTLDPLATGLLPILCGKATKLCNYITDGDKGYRATLKFGIETDTYDITGNVTATDNKTVSINEIESVLKNFTGKIKQIPPAYSAIKVNGTALYKLAREGKEVTVPEREISIHKIDIVDFSDKELIIDVECSKGTYIRSLCFDVARALGTVGTMSALRRTKSGLWSVENALPLDSDNIEKYILPIENALINFPVFRPNDFFARLLSNGCAVEVKKLKNIPDGISRVYSDKLLGLGAVMEYDGKSCFKLITHL